MTQLTVRSLPASREERTEDATVLLLLSRLVGSSKGLTIHSLAATLCRALAFYGTTDLVAHDVAGPAPHADLPLTRWPTGSVAAARSGRKPIELYREYEERKFNLGWTATLPRETIEHYIPAALWPVVATVMAEGPRIAAERADRALQRYARTAVRATKRRVAGSPSPSSVTQMRDAYHRLFDEFVELRRRGLDDPRLEAWTFRPHLDVPETPSTGEVRRAPRPEQLREARTVANANVAEALGLEPGEDELEAIRELTDTEIGTCAAFTPLRDRATFDLVLFTGARVGAVAALRRSDLVHDHVGVPPDRRRGAAMMLRPGKGWGPDLVRFKHLPVPAADGIAAYLLFLDRVVPILHRWHAKWPGRNFPYSSAPADHPLLVSNRMSFRPFGAQGIRGLLSGVCPCGDFGGRKPLIARDIEASELIPVEHRTFLGYSPHEYRRGAQQLAERAGEIWNTRHPAAAGSPQPAPALFGTALLDHKPAGDPMRNLYGERACEAAYELLAGRASEVMGELLTDRSGARKRPDLPAIVARVEELRAVEGQIVFNQRRSDEEYARAPAALPARIEPVEPDSHATDQHRLQYLTRAVAELLRRQDLHIEREERHLRRLIELQRLHDEVFRLTQHRQELHKEIQALWYEQDRWEIVPDSAAPGAEQIDVTLADLLSGGARISQDEQGAAPVRDWVLASEFGWANGLSRAQVARYLRGQNLPAVAARRPWEADAVPVDDSLGRNFRRIWLPGVNPAFWTSGARARLEALITSWPEERGWTINGRPGPRCVAALHVDVKALAPFDVPAQLPAADAAG